MRILILVTSLFFSAGQAIAADTTVEMLNKQGREHMVYSKKIVKVDPGDTVYWKATTKGHNVEFVTRPKGVKKFKSKVSKDTKYKFSVPGIYAYWCTPHKTMGMIGFVVVGGDLSNIDAIKATKFRGKSKKLAKKLIPQLGN